MMLRPRVLLAAVLACLLGATASANAAVLLNPDDVYVATFTELPDASVGYHGYAPSGGASILLSDFDAQADRLEFYIFEETADQLSVAGGIAEAGTDGTALPDFYADHDGGIYLHMLAGSVTLESIRFSFQEPIPGDDVNVLVHSLTVIPEPVPEPGATAVVAAAGCASLLRRQRRH